MWSFIAFEETEQSRIFDNAEFGYSKVTIERPLRATGIDATRAYAPKEIKALKEEGRIAEDGAPVIRRIHKPGKVEADPLRGLFPHTRNTSRRRWTRLRSARPQWARPRLAKRRL
jgi:type I restriction enzyme M protein